MREGVQTGVARGAGRPRQLTAWFYVATALLLSACESKKPPNPFAPPASAPLPVPKLTAAATPKGPPPLEVDAISPKVGFTRVMFDKPSSRAKLAQEVQQNKQHYAGQDLRIVVDRKAQTPWVVALLEELDAAGAGALTVETQTRADLPRTLVLKPQNKAGDAAPCSVVAQVLADRGTAVWKLSGGVAEKWSKGFAGPDLSMTAEAIERAGKACKSSQTAFISGAEGIEWGLVYDLAAATKQVQAPQFEQLVLLREVPTAGRAVKLGS
jgi:hypothetical protein